MVTAKTVDGDLNNVRELAIGVEGGSSGILYIDAIRLYPRQGEVLTPVMPGTANLLAHYALDELRIYDRVLSPAEIAALAGKTEPIYVPF